MKRTEKWRAVYENATADMTLELTISNGHFEWHVHVAPPAERGALRTWLELPMLRLRMPPTGSSLMEGEWCVRMPVIESVDVKITGVGEPVDSFEAPVYVD